MYHYLPWPNSSLLYTITAVSTAENKNGCVFLYFFNTKEALEEFLQNDNSDNLMNIQGYYNNSDECIETDGIPHDAFFSINVTGETFVGIAVNVSANITYTLKGTIVEYNTSNCTQGDTYNLTYNTPLKIDICKSSFCAFQSNETTIVIDSEEQGVLIHWDPKPLELTLAVWIIIFTMVGLAILTCSVFSLYFVVKCLRKIPKKCKKKRGKDLHVLKDETEEIIKVLYKVLESCYDNMSTLFTKDINKIAEKMFENGIITIYLRDDPTYDAIIQSFVGRLNMMKDIVDLKDHCSRFIKSIDDMEETNGNWKKLAKAVKNRWKVAINKKLDIDFNVDVKETN
ncbi:PREDICTED: uncharacterized protein LOC109584819 [Amphimedon queenslandica]|uniref:Uncharacterized protein n=1 Tax=Amphimedon queenslandica TaxID=400682 RepID=A0A1X7U4H9_AMPQE|nr:PREDICTED: uncharacterized protein LOC109584819 [Amphimedon queenslandica]|eukprot:XP_019856253.1 PREDICTED: uncharacterized protein LOC109584819 [Amphimedon queenslandica]